jgi:hypothetical protein
MRMQRRSKSIALASARLARLREICTRTVPSNDASSSARRRITRDPHLETLSSAFRHGQFVEIFCQASGRGLQREIVGERDKVRHMFAGRTDHLEAHRRMFLRETVHRVHVKQMQPRITRGHEFSQAASRRDVLRRASRLRITTKPVSVVGYALPVTTGSPAARHSGRPSSNRRTLKPRPRSAATAS